MHSRPRVPSRGVSYFTAFITSIPLFYTEMSPSSLQPSLSLCRLLISLSSFLNRLSASRFLLFLHFFAVAFYSIYVMFAHKRPVNVNGKTIMQRPRLEQYPFLLFKALRVVSLKVRFLWIGCANVM